MSTIPDNGKLHRRSIRLKDYDYSQFGAYFVTICMKEMKCILGKIQNGKMRLSRIGRIIHQCWEEISNHFDSVKLDVFVVMPNHLHGILFLNVGARFIVPYNKEGFDKSNPYIKNNPMVSNQATLGKIIRFFKAKSTHQIRNITSFPYFLWQRNYYEHVVRNEDELNRIREYVLYNPLQWQYDRENPEYIQDKNYDVQWADFEKLIYGKQKGNRQDVCSTARKVCQTFLSDIIGTDKNVCPTKKLCEQTGCLYHLK